MGRSLGFASGTNNNFALFRLGFPMASVRKTLTGLFTPTRRIIMQKARRHTFNRAPTACRHMVSDTISLPLVGVLFIFRSLYLSTIGYQRVFSLTEWSPLIQPGFHVTQPTQELLGRLLEFRLQDYHLLWYVVQYVSTIRQFDNFHTRVLQPQRENPSGLGFSAFARRY